MNEQLTLFNTSSSNENDNSTENCYGKPRLKTAERNQVEMVMKSLDQTLPKDHLVRDVWAYVDNLDLSVVLKQIKSVEGNAGRPATDPKIFLALWLYGTIKGIGSARVLDEYCQEHDAFKWLCGGVKVNYHSLSDFRSSQGEQLDELLTQSVALLTKKNIISLEVVSQDGMRVRASAGSSSFRREETLEFNLELANMLVADLKKETQENPGACKSRLEAAQMRAAEEKANRIKSALAELEEVRKSKIRTGKKEQRKVKEEDLKNARASMTDPDARIMKMADHGFRPAFNVQFATTNKGKAIIGVDVSKSGSDQKQTMGMIKQVEKRYGQVPEKWLQDGGYSNKTELEKTGRTYKNCKIYMPVKETKTNKEELHTRRADEGKIMGELRERMGTKEAKEIYKERAATAEYANAQARNHGLRQFLVRGVTKAKCVALIFALAHNMNIALNFPVLFD
jgi:transposase